MPIRRELRKFYGETWETITRPHIRARAGGKFDPETKKYLGGAKCERCGVPDWETIVRHDEYPGWWFTLGGMAFDDKGKYHGYVRASEMSTPRFVRIVLTVAHLDGQPGHDDDENLACICQWHHLNHDLPQHLRSARVTRINRKDQRRPLLAEGTA
jgi:hypothetical protein